MGKITTVISKAIGAGAIGAIAYNAHAYGKMLGEEDQKIHTANRLPDEFLNSERLETFNPLTLKLKRYIFKKEMDETQGEMQFGMVGYFEGFTKGLVDNIIPLMLGTGALMFKRAGKLCALGLGLMALKYWRWDIVGHGKAGNLEEH